MSVLRRWIKPGLHTYHDCESGTVKSDQREPEPANVSSVTSSTVGIFQIRTSPKRENEFCSASVYLSTTTTWKRHLVLRGRMPFKFCAGTLCEFRWPITSHCVRLCSIPDSLLPGLRVSTCAIPSDIQYSCCLPAKMTLAFATTPYPA